MENFLEIIIEKGLPYIISALELMGIIVVSWSSVLAFWKFLKGMITRKKSNFMFDFSKSLAAGLEFKMAAEILKTVLIKDLRELMVLGAVILLRGILSILIHFEMKHNK